MNEEIKNRYEFSSWGQTKVSPSIVVSDFIPWSEDCLGWNRTAVETFTEPNGRRLKRTSWDDPRNRDARVVIDVYEMPSNSDARECLIDLLANNQLARLPNGPEDLGGISFVHPKGVVPAAFWVRGNLCLGVHSFGTKMVDAIQWSYRLDSRILDRPAVSRATLTLASKEERAAVEQEIEISFSFPWQIGEEGYYKFFAADGELFFKERQLFFRPDSSGEAMIEAFALEAGRETYGGSLTMRVE